MLKNTVLVVITLLFLISGIIATTVSTGGASEMSSAAPITRKPVTETLATPVPSPTRVDPKITPTPVDPSDPTPTPVATPTPVNPSDPKPSPTVGPGSTPTPNGNDQKNPGI